MQIQKRKKNVVPLGPILLHEASKDESSTNAVAETDQLSDVVDPLAHIRPPTARRGFIMGLQIASLESLFAMFVMLFGDVIISSLLRKVLLFLSFGLTWSEEMLSAVCRLLSFVLTTFFIIHQFTVRHSLTFRAFFLRATHHKTVSLFAVGVILIHASSTIIMYYVQAAAGLNIYSLANYIGPNGGFSYARAFELLFTSPLREEIVFRAVVVSYFYTHVGGHASLHKDKAAIGSAIFFGGVHVVNVFSGSLSPSYAWLQVCMGGLIGYLYGLRLFNSGLIETIILHIANNIFASLLDPSIVLDLSNPIIIISLLQSVAMYGVLCYFSRKQLLTKTAARFPMVDGTPDELLPYSELPEEESSIISATPTTSGSSVAKKKKIALKKPKSSISTKEDDKVDSTKISEKTDLLSPQTIVEEIVLSNSKED